LGHVVSSSASSTVKDAEPEPQTIFPFLHSFASVLASVLVFTMTWPKGAGVEPPLSNITPRDSKKRLDGWWNRQKNAAVSGKAQECAYQRSRRKLAVMPFWYVDANTGAEDSKAGDVWFVPAPSFLGCHIVEGTGWRGITNVDSVLERFEQRRPTLIGPCLRGYDS